mgnify:CR=1 FL=1
MRCIGNFARLQGGTSDGLNTHQAPYYEFGFERALVGTNNPEICDPFARNCEWGTVTNDLDPNTLATSHIDALEFLQGQPNAFFDLVLFDPPFSQIQAERYEIGHKNIYTLHEYVPRCFDEIFRILKPGGKVLSLGYNSTRRSKNLSLIECYIVNFGGNRNDVIMTIWGKNSMTLEDFV